MAKEKKSAANVEIDVMEPVSNGAQKTITDNTPYMATIVIEGTAKLLLHGWNIESIEAKAAAKKGSAEKKTDDIEGYIYRDEKGRIVMPTINFCASIRDAGKSFSDPSSPRKSLRDRLKAIIVPFDEYGLINDGTKNYDFIDRRRVVIQMAGITRSRPAFYEGWTMEFKLMIMAPDYLPKALLLELIDNAGKFQAIGDFRPTYGRYRIKSYNFDVI